MKGQVAVAFDYLSDGDLFSNTPIALVIAVDLLSVHFFLMGIEDISCSKSNSAKYNSPGATSKNATIVRLRML